MAPPPPAGGAPAQHRRVPGGGVPAGRGELLRRGPPVPRILLERSEDHVPDRLRDPVGKRGRFGGQVGRDDGGVVVGVEGRLPGQALVGDRAEGVDVGGVGESTHVELFGEA